MAQHKPTPEEQLLKLIENPSEHQKGDAAQKGFQPAGKFKKSQRASAGIGALFGK